MPVKRKRLQEKDPTVGSAADGAPGPSPGYQAPFNSMDAAPNQPATGDHAGQLNPQQPASSLPWPQADTAVIEHFASTPDEMQQGQEALSEGDPSPGGLHVHWDPGLSQDQHNHLDTSIDEALVEGGGSGSQGAGTWQHLAQQLKEPARHKAAGLLSASWRELWDARLVASSTVNAFEEAHLRAHNVFYAPSIKPELHRTFTDIDDAVDDADVNLPMLLRSGGRAAPLGSERPALVPREGRGVLGGAGNSRGSSESDEDDAWMATAVRSSGRVRGAKDSGRAGQPGAQEAGEGKALGWVADCVQHPRHWAVLSDWCSLQRSETFRWRSCRDQLCRSRAGDAMVRRYQKCSDPMCGVQRTVVELLDGPHQGKVLVRRARGAHNHSRPDLSVSQEAQQAMQLADSATIQQLVHALTGGSSTTSSYNFNSFAPQLCWQYTRLDDIRGRRWTCQALRMQPNLEASASTCDVRSCDLAPCSHINPASAPRCMACGAPRLDGPDGQLAHRVRAVLQRPGGTQLTCVQVHAQVAAMAGGVTPGAGFGALEPRSDPDTQPCLVPSDTGPGRAEGLSTAPEMAGGSVGLRGQGPFLVPSMEQVKEEVVRWVWDVHEAQRRRQLHGHAAPRGAAAAGAEGVWMSARGGLGMGPETSSRAAMAVREALPVVRLQSGLKRWLEARACTPRQAAEGGHGRGGLGVCSEGMAGESVEIEAAGTESLQAEGGAGGMAGEHGAQVWGSNFGAEDLGLGAEGGSLVAEGEGFPADQWQAGGRSERQGVGRSRRDLEAERHRVERSAAVAGTEAAMRAMQHLYCLPGQHRGAVHHGGASGTAAAEARCPSAAAGPSVGSDGAAWPGEKGAAGMAGGQGASWRVSVHQRDSLLLSHRLVGPQAQDPEGGAPGSGFRLDAGKAGVTSKRGREEEQEQPGGRGEAGARPDGGPEGGVEEGDWQWWQRRLRAQGPLSLLALRGPLAPATWGLVMDGATAPGFRAQGLGFGEGQAQVAGARHLCARPCSAWSAWSIGAGAAGVEAGLGIDVVPDAAAPGAAPPGAAAPAPGTAVPGAGTEAPARSALLPLLPPRLQSALDQIQQLGFRPEVLRRTAARLSQLSAALGPPLGEGGRGPGKAVVLPPTSAMPLAVRQALASAGGLRTAGYVAKRLKACWGEGAVALSVEERGLERGEAVGGYAGVQAGQGGGDAEVGDDEAAELAREEMEVDVAAGEGDEDGEEEGEEDEEHPAGMGGEEAGGVGGEEMDVDMAAGEGDEGQEEEGEGGEHQPGMGREEAAGGVGVANEAEDGLQVAGTVVQRGMGSDGAVASASSVLQSSADGGSESESSEGGGGSDAEGVEGGIGERQEVLQGREGNVGVMAAESDDEGESSASGGEERSESL